MPRTVSALVTYTATPITTPCMKGEIIRSEDIVFARDAAFILPAVHFPDFLAAELEARTGAAAILGNEHHARGLERGPQPPARGFVRGAKAALEIRNGLQVDGRGLRELRLGPLDERARGAALS